MLPELDYKDIDAKVKDNTLTESDVNKILDTIREASSENSDLKILNDIKNIPLKPGEEGTVGGYVKAQIKIDPITGERINLTEDDKLLTEEEVNNTMTVSEAIEKIADNPDVELVCGMPDITEEDIINKTPEIFNIPEEMWDEYKPTIEEAHEVVDIIHRLTNNENVSIYTKLPDKFKVLVNKTLKYKGYADHSVAANTMRTKLCLEIINAYIVSITKDKYENTVVKLFEDIQNNDSISFSSLITDYDKHRVEVLNSIKESIREDDTESLKKVEDMLAATKDAYDLTRLIEAAPKCKLRSIDIDKPQSRIFNEIESKYRYIENLHIPAQYSLFNILSRHNKRTDKDNLKFFLVLSKVCMNYRPEQNYAEHLFMFSTMRNIVYLDVYKHDDYEKLAKPFLENINKVIDNCKG